MRIALCLLAGATLCAPTCLPQQAPTPAGTPGGEYKSSLLYTSPAPEATGGLHMVSSVPLEFALAISESNPEHVYRAALGPDKEDVTFSNLPVSKYDLVLTTKDQFYEGVSLNRDESSLTPDDRKAIEEIFSRSIPFLNVKRTEAVKGTPGDGGRAMALVQWMRVGGNLLNQNGDLLAGHQIRSLRLAFLADVGVGWQVTATRELLRTDVFPDMLKGFLPVLYLDALSGVRVTDSVKNIGTITLSAAVPLGALSQ